MHQGAMFGEPLFNLMEAFPQCGERIRSAWIDHEAILHHNQTLRKQYFSMYGIMFDRRFSDLQRSVSRHTIHP